VIRGGVELDESQLIPVPDPNRSGGDLGDNAHDPGAKAGAPEPDPDLDRHIGADAPRQLGRTLGLGIRTREHPGLQNDEPIAEELLPQRPLERLETNVASAGPPK
jgi:hypothetical protein